ncbi:MAG: hypothetical protein LV471_09285 [Nitrosomonas sp.]|nr:hypothetical protein [Nitrosomonas sp.]
MATIDDLVSKFLTDERPVAVILDPATVLAQAVAATEFYAGYAKLEINDLVDPPYPDITGATTISLSEWALIKPLFLLYVERETAPQLEASRMLGVDVFGRATSEIQQDINQMMLDMPQKAFLQLIITV